MTARRIVYALALAGLCAFWIFYDGRVSVYLFLIVLALPFVSLLISLPFLRKPRLVTDVPKTVARGEECAFVFRILSLDNGDKPCLLPGTVRAAVRDLMDGTREKYAFSLPGDADIRFRAEHCGVWQVETVRAYVTDFLGLWRFRVRPSPPSRLTVFPVPAKPSPEPDFASLRTASFHPKQGGGFSEFHELREYRPGDPVRTLHWKASAKTDKPVVREAQEIRRLRALLVCCPTADRSDADAALDALTWVSGELLRGGIPHEIYSASSGQFVPVSVKEDLDAFVGAFLSSPAARNDEETPIPSFDAEWVFYAGSKVRPTGNGGKEGTA